MDTLIITSLKCLSIYLLVLICLRILGKKRVAEISPTDLVFLILIGSTLGQQLPENNKWAGAIIGIISLTSANYFLNWAIYKSKKFRKLVEGEPTVLIRNGKILNKNLQQEQITLENLNEAIRDNGLKTIEEVELAILETDGKISIINKKSKCKE